jgi:hypothetical protein
MGVRFGAPWLVDRSRAGKQFIPRVYTENPFEERFESGAVADAVQGRFVRFGRGTDFKVAEADQICASFFRAPAAQDSLIRHGFFHFPNPESTRSTSVSSYRKPGNG